MNNAKNLLLSALLASPAAAQGGLTLPPSEPDAGGANVPNLGCLLYTSPSPRDRQKSRMPSSA